MKVVHVVRQFSPSVGGLEASVFSLATAQRRRFDIDARVVSLNQVFGREGILPASEVIGTIPVTRIAWRGSPRYPLAPSILTQLRGADLVHVHAVDFFFDFLGLTAPILRKPLVASTHGGFFHTSQQARLKRLWFNTITRASCLAYRRIVACSRSDAETFEAIARRKLTLIENGIDQARLADAASLRQNRTIIYFGRFTEHKRIAAIFPLLHALRQQHPDWRLLIAGRDSEQSAAGLRTLSEAEGIKGAVDFDIDPRDDALRTLIGRASYFCCLSSYEGFGLAAVEAMSAGLFPILSDIAPFKRLSAETGLGLISASPDLKATAADIEASVTMSESEYANRRAALMASVKGYDWESAAAQYARVYREVLAHRPKREQLAFRQ